MRGFLAACALFLLPRRTLAALVGAALACACLAVPAEAGQFGLVGIAKRYEGMNARQIGLARKTLWCGTFMGHVADRAGIKKPKNPHAARAWAQAGTRLKAPRVGAIVVFPRGKRGGHVGVVAAVNGKTIRVVSGNHGNRVAEASYPVSRAIAFVEPEPRAERMAAR